MSRKQSESSSMSFGEHLEELRKRLFWALAIPLPLSIVLFFVAPQIRGFLCGPAIEALHAHGLPATLQVMAPAETLTTDFKISLIGALSVGGPWVLWQVWLFVSPGLYVHERRFARFLVPLSGMLVAGALALLYWVMLPLILSGLIAFGEAPPTAVATATTPTLGGAAVAIVERDPESAAPGELWFNTEAHELRLAVPAGDAGGSPEPVAEGEVPAAALEIVTIGVGRPAGLQQVFRLKDYIDFILLIALAVVITFQLPVAILLAGWLGIVDPAMLRAKRRIALFVISIIAAIAGPGDALTMLLLIVPLYALYEGSILLLVMAPAHRVAAGTVGRSHREPDGDADGDA